MPSSAINPQYITSAPVSKEQTRTQFQAIKDAIAEVEAQTAATQSLVDNIDAASGWRRLSVYVVPGQIIEARCALPDGYSRYRIEFEQVNFNGTGQLSYRASANDVSYYTSAGSYNGVAVDSSASSNTNYSAGNTEALLTANCLSTPQGVCGHMEFDSQRLQCIFQVHYVGSTGPTRYLRSGVMYHNIARHVQFFVSGFTLSLMSGMFTVMARP